MGRQPSDSAGRSPLPWALLAGAVILVSAWLAWPREREGGDVEIAALGDSVVPADTDRAVDEPEPVASRRGVLEPGGQRKRDARPEPGRERERGERALMQRYLALESARPGRLAAEAEGWLAGERPASEKVAWLRALDAVDPASAVEWLEFSSRLADPANGDGVGPAAFAVERLSARASGSVEVRAALARIAADARRVSPELRRSAATRLAACAPAEELLDFESAMLAETDAGILRGVAAALRSRDDAATAGVVVRWLARAPCEPEEPETP